MFNLFGKKDKGGSKTKFKDVVWISTAAKFQGLVAAYEKDPQTIFIGWFPEAVRSFREFAAGPGIGESQIMEARFIHASHLQDKKVIFIEHYPLHEKEKAFAEKFQLEEVKAYSALDEPIFKLFGGDKIVNLMRTMGLKEDEAVEHAMLSKSIVNAQEKIAGKVPFDQTADSQEAWMSKNIKTDLKL